MISFYPKHYAGVAVILDRVSAYDKHNSAPLSGPARLFVEQTLDLKLHQLYVAHFDLTTPIPNGTRYIIYAGDRIKPDEFYTSAGYVNVSPSGVRSIQTYNPSDFIAYVPPENDDSEEETEDAADSSQKDMSVISWKNYRGWFVRDIRKLFLPRLLNSYKPPTKVFLPVEAVLSFLTSDHPYLVVDIENNPKDNTLWCIGVCSPAGAFVIPIYTPSYKLHYPPADLLKILVAFVQLSRRTTVVGHNVAFDFSLLYIHYGFPLPRILHDTMVMAHRVAPELEKGLGVCGRLYANVRWHKDAGGTWYPKDNAAYNRLCLYNLQDILLTEVIYRELLTNHDSPSQRQANRSVGNYLRVSLTGLPINELARYKARDRLQTRILWLTRIVNTLIGYDINIKSTVQLSNYLYAQMQYPVISKTDTGNPAVGAETLYRLMTKHDNPALTAILRLTEARTHFSKLNFTTFSHDT